jgi:curved DNA-binding protein CbpA
VTDADPYTVLGLIRQASLLDIKKAYFKLVRQHPPENDPDGFRRIRNAYESLRTPQARANTDRQLIQAPPPLVMPRRALQPDLTFHLEDAWLSVRRSSDLERCDGASDFRPLPDLSEV